jgi:thiol-disulfide isomerase/thioredoxin
MRRLLTGLMLSAACLLAPSAVVFAPQAALAQSGGPLTPGKPAPQMKNVTWLKGEPISEWQKGQIYVIDFWATWCGPCIAAMPHMNDVQKKYADKGVNVIGLAIWPRPKQKETKGFVEARGAQMGYRVAEDDKAGTNAKAFMQAANQNGIPTVMIIDRAGTLAWIGHPMDGMDDALEAIVSGTFDVTKQAEAQKAAEAKEEATRQLMNDFGAAQMASDWPKAVEITDKMLALDPENLSGAGIYKYLITLTKIEDSARAAAIGRELLAGPFKGKHDMLSIFAMAIMQEEQIKDEQRDTQLAFDAATLANDGSEGKNPNALAALAAVHYSRNEKDKAVEFQGKALELVKDDEQARVMFQAQLDKYSGKAEEATPAEATPAEAKPEATKPE